VCGFSHREWHDRRPMLQEPTVPRRGGSFNPVGLLKTWLERLAKSHGFGQSPPHACWAPLVDKDVQTYSDCNSKVSRITQSPRCSCLTEARNVRIWRGDCK
jgi:hypothetical protein